MLAQQDLESVLGPLLALGSGRKLETHLDFLSGFPLGLLKTQQWAAL
jgi:hypothetical protein